MAEEETFKSFASEVRDSYDILLTKLKSIKMSVDEARLRQKYADEDEEKKSVDAIKVLKLVRPETPKNIRALFRAVTKDINRLRQAFRGFSEDLVQPQDRQQLDRIIQDLERHLQARTQEVENLKAGRNSGKKPKSARAKSARAKSAIQKTGGKSSSTQLNIPTDSENESLSKTPSQICIGELADISTDDDKSTPRKVISTKVIKQTGQKRQLGNDESKAVAKEQDYTYSRERTWGAFHGQKTLSKKGMVLKLPVANSSGSLVRSQASDTDSNSPEVKLKRTEITIAEKDIHREPSKLARSQKRIQEAGNTRLAYQGRDQGFFMPNPRRYVRHDVNARPERIQKQFTNLERADLNSGLSTTSARRQRSEGRTSGRTPSYLVSRSRTVPDVDGVIKKARLPKPVIAFGRSTSFQELPPLASLKRGLSSMNQDSN